MRVPLSALHVGDDHPPGLDIDHVRRLVVGEITDLRPITVVPAGCRHWEVVNGRHRYVAAMVRGDPTVEIEVRCGG